MSPKEARDLINWKKDNTLSARKFVRLLGGNPPSLIHKGRKRRRNELKV